MTDEIQSATFSWAQKEVEYKTSQCQDIYPHGLFGNQY